MKEFVSEKVKTLFKTYTLTINKRIYYLEEIKDIKEFIIENLKKGNDLLLNFVEILYKPNFINRNYALVSEIKGRSQCFNKSFWEVKLKKLVNGTNTGAQRRIVIFSTEKTL